MATTCEIIGQKAKIDYPANWEYKIIFLKEVDAKKALDDLLLKKEYKLKESNKSKGGKYTSYNLTTLVHNEKEREEIFSLLKQNKNIKYVL